MEDDTEAISCVSEAVKKHLVLPIVWKSTRLKWVCVHCTIELCFMFIGLGKIITNSRLPIPQIYVFPCIYSVFDGIEVKDK